MPRASADVALNQLTVAYREHTAVPHGRDLQARALDARRVVAFHQHVVVDQEEQALSIGLQTRLDGGPDGTDVITEVGCARSGEAGECALGHRGCGRAF